MPKLARALALGVLLAASSATVSALEFIFPSESLVSGEVDLFDFTLDSTSFVAIATFDLSFDNDTILTLLDDMGDFITDNDDTEFGLESVIVTELTAGDYTAAVSGFDNFFPFFPPPSDFGDYSLVIFGDGVSAAAFAGSFIVPLPPAFLLIGSALLAVICVRRPGAS